LSASHSFHFNLSLSLSSHSSPLLVSQPFSAICFNPNFSFIPILNLSSKNTNFLSGSQSYTISFLSFIF
jgi:hypothetical protein